MNVHARLQKIADAYLPLFDNMPSVPIKIVDEPYLPGPTPGSRKVAYYRHPDRFIVIRLVHLMDYPESEIKNTIVHELTHAWIYWKGIKDGDHGPEFQKKFAEVWNKVSYNGYPPRNGFGVGKNLLVKEDSRRYSGAGSYAQVNI